mmetsp:Transcript_25003/g.62099  ORF Transcript_25003/g.62099 Transcript_25003/m.62099 type:complete len:91 (-) Transcript_25003:96-368(-)|eukprot:4842429-Prymnesium_polylepis.1
MPDRNVSAVLWEHALLLFFTSHVRPSKCGACDGHGWLVDRMCALCCVHFAHSVWFVDLGARSVMAVALAVWAAHRGAGSRRSDVGFSVHG